MHQPLNERGAIKPEVAAMVARLNDKTPEVAMQLADRILDTVWAYSVDSVVEKQDLVASCADNVGFMFSHLGRPDLPVDVSAPRRTGRLRAEQGVPLSAVQETFRIGFGVMWDWVVAEARGGGEVSDTDLVELASQVWTLNDIFTSEMATAYRNVMIEQIRQRDQERSALVEALLQGRVADVATVWEAADLLSFPYQGTFVVVAAAVSGLPRLALPGVETRLRARDIASIWRLQPDVQLGIVSLRADSSLEVTVEILRSLAAAPVGVSPSYSGLEGTSRAVHLARVSMESVPNGAAEVSVFADAPLAALAVSSPTTSYEVVRRVLGPLLEVAEDERGLLLETLETWFQVGGSAVEAGARLYCHPNTVRHRLRRIEQRTGRSVEDPLGSAELYVALEALRRLPAIPTV